MMVFTMSNTNLLCDFCGALLNGFVYEPIGTKRAVKVRCCSVCGLYQSETKADYIRRPPGSMSSDADRSSFRYTKDIVADRYSDIFNKYISKKCKNVLDIGSNRGAFIEFSETFFDGEGTLIHAIEPDLRVTDSYKNKSNVSLQVMGVEDAYIEKGSIDFVFSTHSLEHVNSINKVFNNVNKWMADGALFFLAVPNTLFFEDIIEEVFIDPHTFHFTPTTLRAICNKFGFDIIYQTNDDHAEINFLLKKVAGVSEIYSFENLKEYSKECCSKLIEYSKMLPENRNYLRNMASKLHEKSLNRDLVIWGGGRILDALIKHGNLNTSKIKFVLDKYLFKYNDAIHNIPLLSPNDKLLNGLENPLLFIASREYGDEIESEAVVLGFNEIIRFGNNV